MGKVKDLTNQKFGRLTAIKATKPENGYMMWLCKCDCGNEATVSSHKLTTGKVKSCGCLRIENAQRAGSSRLRDLTGKKFGELTVIKESSGRTGKYADVTWECQCSCGNIAIVRGKDLMSGNTQSCGCIKPEAQSKSGKEHIDAILKGFVEGTNLAVLNAGPSKRNKSGYKGVFWNNTHQKWQAMLYFQGKQHYLGQFNELEDAAKARAEAEEKYFKPILEKYDRKTTDEE